MSKRPYLFWGKDVRPSYFVEIDSEGLPCAVSVRRLHQGGRVLLGFVFLGEEALRMLDGGYLTFDTVAAFSINLVVRSTLKIKNIISFVIMIFKFYLELSKILDANF